MPLTDRQWAIIAPHGLGRECDLGRTGPDPRLFVEAVLWIVRTGCSRRDLPDAFETWNSVFKRLCRGVKADAFHRMFSALADAFGNLTDFRLLPGQAHDLCGRAALMKGLSCEKLLADRAFDAHWLRKTLTSAGIEPVIPPRSNRRFPAEFDRATCKRRHPIENVFGKPKECRGLAMRCCKTDQSFSPFIALAATVIHLR